MKAHALRVLARAGVPLILAGTADAGFVGIKVVGKPVPPGSGIPTTALVCEVFATFDRPGQDRFNAAAGLPISPMEIQVVGGTFYQGPRFYDSDTAPSAPLVGVFPSIAFDTFVTIGAKTVGPGGQSPPPLYLTPAWPGFGPSFLGGSSIAWANTPVDPNTDPFNPAFYLGNGQLLIGQFTTLDGNAISGMFRVLVISNNVNTQINVSFFHVPGPGALSLLGPAALSGTRRRQRGRPGPARRPPRAVAGN